MSSLTLLLFIVSLYFSAANPIYYKYVRDDKTSQSCTFVTPDLVAAVANNHFNSNLTIIFFDDLYYVDYNFKLILSEILKKLTHMTVMFGPKKSIFEVPRGNELPAWVIFSGQMDAMPGKTLLFSHNTPFQIKEWLTTPVAKKFMHVVAVSDPALMRSRGGERDCEIGLYTHSLNTELSSSSSSSIITSWRKDRFTQNINIFPNKYKKGYGGIHLTVAVYEQPPYAFKRIGSSNELIWEGVEVRLIEHLSKILDFTFEFREITLGNQVVFGHQSKSVDMVIGRQVNTVPLHSSTALTFPHFIDCAAFISLTSTALPKYRAIMGPFLWDVWIALTMTYLLAVIPLAFSSWHTLRPLIENPSEIEIMFWYVFGTFTNLFTFSDENSWSKGNNCSTKIFIGTYWVFTIIITACYTGSIIAFITLPVYPDIMDTMHQLLHNNYRVVTLDQGGWWSLLTSADDDDASGLAGTASTVSDYYHGISDVRNSAKEDKPIAFLASKEHLTYIINTNFSMSKIGKRQMFHISQQCFVPQLISIALPSGSLYKDSFNHAILRALETGLISKFYNEMEREIYKVPDRNLLQGSLKMDAIERQLTLDDTQGMFLLLGSGFAIALCSYVFELATWVKNREGEKLTTLAKNRIMEVSRRVSEAILAPTNSHVRAHYPLYFRSDYKRNSSVFGSLVTSAPAFSQVHLKPEPLVEKPVRLLSF